MLNRSNSDAKKHIPRRQKGTLDVKHYFLGSGKTSGDIGSVGGKGDLYQTTARVSFGVLDAN